jgi:metal-dependent hydrolase (beta-lactamase superfamily II)
VGPIEIASDSEALLAVRPPGVQMWSGDRSGYDSAARLQVSTVEIGGRRILFDTGNDPDIFAQNVKAAGVDLQKLDFVVMSHRHGDHMGGMAYLIGKNPRVKIYAPQEGFGVYGASLPCGFFRKDESLPQEMRYYDGKPPEVLRFGSAWPTANIVLIDKTTEIAPGATLIAQVSDAPGTKELKELSLAINTPEGIVLIVGCPHPGIEAIVAEAAAISPHIRVIAGGFHLGRGARCRDRKGRGCPARYLQSREDRSWPLQRRVHVLGGQADLR